MKMQTSEHKKLASVRSQADRNDDKEGEQTPKKGKKFLKSLLSRRKSRKEEPLPCYFDDYWVPLRDPMAQQESLNTFYIVSSHEKVCPWYEKLVIV